ncbi:MAG: outer membrane lipoprotein carrier protein LolA [Chitinophagaceae bacterium]|nr:outer membrane lipoprotein carrier protein LolA [Chitinophagaceae bacterium]MCE2759031.1 outer membrane lipoprotein carrier protein LolA [Chitinophagaceae bacterium]
MVSSFAQAPKGMGKSDPEAKKVLDAVSAKFKTFKAIKAAFALKIENAAGKVQGVKTGTILMKSVKYRVSITGQEIFCDGTTIWTYDVAAKEVQVSSLDNSSGAITPQKLFTNFYDKDFLFVLGQDIKKSGKTYKVVELTPIDKTKSFFKVVIEVDKATSVIMSTRVFEKNGNRYLYAINSINTNATVADDSFSFNPKKYPGVELIDLR